MAQMQWRGWSTYSDIVAVWNWLDTEQSMINFVTEMTKVCVCVSVLVSRSQTTIFFFCVGAGKNRVWYNCVTISVLTFHCY